MSVDRHEDSIVIAAPLADVYAVVSDVTRVGEWSPVCRACWWEDDAERGVGAWFGGRNESGGRVWETRSQVKEAEPGVAFAWQVDGNLVAWAYRLRAVEGGTELSESWAINDATKQVFVEKYGEHADRVIDDRRQEALTGIPATLARIRQIVEGAA
ncbi:SRPBCC family protein [Nocardioides mangrovicus]|uniref:SRPBCC family protein n=1 Tax=Nocardioides mangrovicus TaxID=2478913 RepID=A0A3L8P4V2_9ACTN|nr:SRPBCC family protein [Nocardioides mangrovicus]RLV49619.1 SRPBCC family protein [Nocardioides mangrovicus]